MIYQAVITGFGDLALDFLGEDMLILFNENAPPELQDLSVLHTHGKLSRNIMPGDMMRLGNKEYVVLAVGDEANYTFSVMGHCTLKFTGKDQVDLPGQIELLGDGLPELKIGDPIEIYE